jgi:hypothetical protein
MKNNILVIGMIAGVIVALAAGYGIYKWISRQPNVLPSLTADGNMVSVPQQALLDIFNRLNRKIAETTTQSRNLLDSLHIADAEIDSLKRHEQASMAIMNDTTKTLEQRFHACSVVVLDCERRAYVAESTTTRLRAQLKAQAALQASRCGLNAGPAVSLQVTPKVGVVWSPLSLSLSCRLF